MQYLGATSKTTEWSLFIKGKPFNIAVIQVYAPSSNAKEAEVELFYEDLQDLLELNTQKDLLFIIRDWNAKVGSQEIRGVMGKFHFGIPNEVGQSFVSTQETSLSSCSAGDLGSIPGLGRSPGEGNATHSSSWLENPMDRGAWQTMGSPELDTT